jgi:hypothetical protein
MNASLATSRQAVAAQIFVTLCPHLDENGLDAYANFGPEEWKLQQCIICGDVKCTELPDDDNIDLAEVYGRI